MVDVTVASELTEVHACGDHEYGEQTNDGGVVERYQCMGCGHVLADAHGAPVVDALWKRLYELLA